MLNGCPACALPFTPAALFLLVGMAICDGHHWKACRGGASRISRAHLERKEEGGRKNERRRKEGQERGRKEEDLSLLPCSHAWCLF